MAYDDFGKSRGIVEAEIVHVGSARREWRVMHQDHGRPIKLRRECSVEPTQSLVAQHPAMLIGDERVEGGKPYWVIFDRVLQVAFGRQVAGVPKSLAQRLSGIVATLNALVPRPDVTVVTGDLVDHGENSCAICWHRCRCRSS